MIIATIIIVFPVVIIISSLIVVVVAFLISTAVIVPVAVVIIGKGASVIAPARVVHLIGIIIMCEVHLAYVECA